MAHWLFVAIVMMFYMYAIPAACVGSLHPKSVLAFWLYLISRR